MTTGPETAHTAETTPPILPNWLSHIVALCIMLLIMLCLGMFFPFVVGYHLLVGWFQYLQRVMNSQALALGQVVWFIIVLAVIVTGLHLVLKQSYRWRQRVQTPAPEAVPLSPWRKRWTSSVLILLLILGGSGLAAVEISQQVRSMATSDEQLVTRQYSYSSYGCGLTKNHLKQMGLALHNYHDEFRQFPIGATVDPTGKPQHGWVARVLPFLDRRGESRAFRDHITGTTESGSELLLRTGREPAGGKVRLSTGPLRCQPAAAGS
ncbi:hypothetical protein Pan153_01270 [Gimesia panareensis]|uniref:DUF1559 domain-containing protein n=1 Tax=Gimesia panareensis TaxID=2527978 RepID=A0A518FGQ0_9PLAN|nr:hypothetical protein Pan153_01270 [Gimesia panareensis]